MASDPVAHLAIRSDTASGEREYPNLRRIWSQIRFGGRPTGDTQRVLKHACATDYRGISGCQKFVGLSFDQVCFLSRNEMERDRCFCSAQRTRRTQQTRG